MHQKTLRQSCEIHGIGLHSGQTARVVIHPAPADHGIVFRVKHQGQTVDIPAKVEYVTRTVMSTNLGVGQAEVCTVEHLLAALTGLEIDNALVEVDGCEVPMMDGSAHPFVVRLRAAGLKTLPSPRRMLRVLAPIELNEDSKFAALYPSDHTTYQFCVDFAHPAIQRQEIRLAFTSKNFVNEVSRARTFGFEADLQALQAKGLALGAGLQNAVGLGRDGSVLNAEGLRFPDEFARHKLLDAIGDLSLGGVPLLAEYRGYKSGHALNLKLVQTLLANPQSWEVVAAADFIQAQAV